MLFKETVLSLARLYFGLKAPPQPPSDGTSHSRYLHLHFTEFVCQWGHVSRYDMLLAGVVCLYNDVAHETEAM